MNWPAGKTAHTRAEIVSWCGWLRRVLVGAAREEDVEPEHRRAFRFLKMRGGPYVENRGGFFAATQGDSGERSRVRLDGLTGQLDRIFHPVRHDVSTGGAATGGSVRGMKVDKQMEFMIKGRPMEEDMSPYTRDVCLELQRLGLTPFDAQVPVGNIALRLATTLDLVCATARGGLVNVQVKSGFENRNNYDSSVGRFFMSPYVKDSKLERTPITHHAMHFIQVTAEHMIYQLSHGADNRLSYSLLMVVSERIVTSESVPPFGESGRTNPILPSEVYENLLKREEDLGVDIEVAAVRARHVDDALRKTRRGKRDIPSGRRH
jgi:hypothetical protein